MANKSVITVLFFLRSHYCVCCYERVLVNPDGTSLIACTTTSYFYSISNLSLDTEVPNSSKIGVIDTTTTQAASWPIALPWELCLEPDWCKETGSLTGLQVDTSSFFFGGTNQIYRGWIEQGLLKYRLVATLSYGDVKFVCDEIIPFSDNTVLLLNRADKEYALWQYTAVYPPIFRPICDDVWSDPHGMTLSPSRDCLLVVTTGVDGIDGGGSIYRVDLTLDSDPRSSSFMHISGLPQLLTVISADQP
jgi:hypothetical protein